MPQWQDFIPGHWVGFGVILYHSDCMAFYGNRQKSLVEEKWLKRAGVKEGDVVLDEGFGMGTPSIVADCIGGPKGKVYTLDNEPVHVLILCLRAKIRLLKNLKVHFIRRRVYQPTK